MSFGNYLLSANPFPGCVPIAFSGCASASVIYQAVTLDCAVKVRWALRLPKGNHLLFSPYKYNVTHLRRIVNSCNARFPF